MGLFFFCSKNFFHQSISLHDREIHVKHEKEIKNAETKHKLKEMRTDVCNGEVHVKGKWHQRA